MIINNNIPALNMYRQMGNNQLAGSKAMEKLSSGLSINRAGDDAAGLAISEKMRAQVRGLDQASRNAQDGVSLIQTAEGALGETHSILQRMRELATQAANDTNVDVDRKEIQKEINQLTSEVNRIGNTTEFNTRKLLNADGADSEAIQNVLDGIQNKGWLEVAEKMIIDNFGLQGDGSKLSVEFINDSSSNTSAFVTGSTGTTDQKLTINLAHFSPSEGENGDNNSGGANYSDRVLAHEMAHAVMNSAFGVEDTIDMPSWFKEGAAEFIHGGDERLKSHISDGAGGIDSTKLSDLISRASNLLNGAEWNGDSKDYAAGYLAMKYLADAVSDAGNTTADLMQDIRSLVGSNSGNNALESAIANQTSFANFADFKADFTDSDVSTYVNSLELNFSGAETDTGSVAGSEHGGISLNAEDVIDNNTATGTLLQNFNVELPDSDSLSSSINLQIGANSGQSFSIQLKDMRASALNISGMASGEAVSSDGKVKAFYTETDTSNGVTDGTNNEVKEYALDISTHEKATAAIKVFNDAIEKVSSFRSELGASQNRLEHTISNLGTSSENLQAAESRIRDVDMAKEIMEMTRANILSQASQAMLAQANQKPQSVLQILG